MGGWTNGRTTDALLQDKLTYEPNKYAVFLRTVQRVEKLMLRILMTSVVMNN